jgi:hypothetical protein
MALFDPGCVKTPKGRTLTGILFLCLPELERSCEHSPNRFAVWRMIVLRGQRGREFLHGQDPNRSFSNISMRGIWCCSDS